MTVEQLRRMAKLNLCEECYEKYTMLLEPQIKEWRSAPIGDWTQVEADIDWMVLKAKGGYRKRTDSTVISPDMKAFRRVQKQKLWEKLKFLNEAGILGDNSYEFLDKVSKIRNRIHRQEGFSEKDYSLFRQAKELTNAIVTPILFDLEDNVHQRLLASIENHAKQLLSKLKL